MVLLDFGFSFWILYDSWWVLVIFQEKEEKENGVEKIDMGLEFGLIPFVSYLLFKFSLSLSLSLSL